MRDRALSCVLINSAWCGSVSEAVIAIFCLVPRSFNPDMLRYHSCGDQKINALRKVLNEFIHSSHTFDQVADMESAVLDTATGATRDEYAP